MKPLRLLSKILGVAVGLSVLAAATMAYFVSSVDPATGAAYDGLGRILSRPPLWAQMLVTEENRWAGLLWHIADVVWFFGGIWLSYLFFDWGRGVKIKKEDTLEY